MGSCVSPYAQQYCLCLSFPFFAFICGTVWPLRQLVSLLTDLNALYVESHQFRFDLVSKKIYRCFNSLPLINDVNVLLILIIWLPRL